ncbi:TRAP transporter small permease subunit [Tateyamaria armeniaca]|uniref:TRAP transporter small permease protein n=1 Tax=Tateyamaria armeniaca TaxID=2518930 RepID=A0ABW8UVN4_9RHOB
MTYLERLALWLGRMSAWCFAAIILVMVYEVAARYGFNAPTTWAHEASILLASAGFVFGGAFCMAEGTHMRISFLVEKRPGLARLSNALSLIAGAIYLSGLCYASWRMAEKALWRFSLSGAWDPERSGSTLNSPLPSYLKVLLFVGCVIFLLLVLQRMIPRRNA